MDLLFEVELYGCVLVFCNGCVVVLYSILLVNCYCVRLLKDGFVGIVHFVTFICSMLCCFGLTIGIGMCGIVLLFYICLSLYLICGLVYYIWEILKGYFLCWGVGLVVGVVVVVEDVRDCQRFWVGIHYCLIRIFRVVCGLVDV